MLQVKINIRNEKNPTAEQGIVGYSKRTDEYLSRTLYTELQNGSERAQWGDILIHSVARFVLRSFLFNSVVLPVSPTDFLTILRTPNLWIYSLTSYDYPVSVASIHREIHESGLTSETTLIPSALACFFPLSVEDLYLNTALLK